MPAERTCSQCGAPLPDNAPGYRCPKCLLALALDDTAAEGGTPEITNALPESAILTEQTGTAIGRYKLLQEIGEGGFGVVFMAEQQEPVQRKVALKVIKAGMDTREIIARFEAERQALALMDHPNIAQVLDGGTTAGGRPYFVMELVRGVPITNFCDHANLSTRERLELFIKVCRAVQHAHQKGVIHRDLKPNNVLVTLHDGEPVPKVIDFGVAKALGQKLTEKTLFTRFEQMIGTPAYMSPEQAALSGLDVDTRSDVYSLGVLLYELLTGVTPLDAETLRQGALDEIRRLIQETDPPKPSTRVATLGERLADVARRRGAEPASLHRLIRGDLDWITMKALEKDRQRRYETANGLAADIERHLNHEPVVARPPSAAYRLQRAVQRHCLAFAAGIAVVIALILGVVVSTWQAARATRAEHEQRRQRERADDEATHAKRAEQQTREQLWKSYLHQARANRWSGRPGRRFDSLEVLREAAEIRPAPELRNEAIACMALSDIRPIKEWDAPVNGGTFCNFDRNYERYAFGQTNGILRVCRVSDDQELLRLSGFKPPYYRVNFSPDDQLLGVICKSQSDLELWDLAGKTLFMRVTGTITNSFCRDFAFSGDSRFAAVAHLQDTTRVTSKVRIFDLNLRRGIASLDFEGVCWELRFHPSDPSLLLITDGTPVVRLWDWRSGKVRTFQHPDWVRGVDWHPGGKLLAAACTDSKIYLWALGQEDPFKILKGHETSVIHVCFDTRDADLLVSTGWDGTLRLWDPTLEAPLVSRPSDSIFTHVGNGRLVCKTANNHCTLLEIAMGEECRMLHSALEAKESTLDCAFHPNGHLLAWGHRDGVRLLSVPNGKEIARLGESHPGTVLFHPGGRSLMVSTEEGLSQWPMEYRSTETNVELRVGPPVEIGEKGKMEELAFAPDGTLLAVIEAHVGAADARMIHVFDTETRREKYRLRGPGRTWFVTISPDKKFLAASDFGSPEVWVWDLADGKLVKKLRTNKAAHAIFSPDNKWLVTSDIAEHKFWRVGSWEPASSLRGPATEGSFFLAFSSDARMMAISSRNTFRLLEASSMRELANVECPSPLSVTGLRFSPDGSQLAAVTGHRLIELWDLRLIRRQLAAMKLDWDAPPLAPPSQAPTEPFTVTVLGATNQSRIAESRRHYDRASNYERIGQYAEAVAEYEKAIELRPSSARAYNSLAWAYVTWPTNFRSPDKALPLALKAVQLSKSKYSEMNTLGVVYYRLGQFETAVATLEAAIQLPDSSGGGPEDFFPLAVAWHRLGEHAKAESYFVKGLNWIAAQSALSASAREEANMFRAEATEALGKPKGD